MDDDMEQPAYIGIQGANAPLNDDMEKIATSPCKEPTPRCMPINIGFYYIYFRLLQHTIIQGAIAPLDDDMGQLAISPYKERTPHCMAT